MAQRERDPISGLETTGHEWDGVKELNTPLPTWWIYVLWATIIWSVGYWIVYPAWPMFGGATPGVIGYSSRADVTRSIAAAEAAKAPWRERLLAVSLEEAAKDPGLLNYAIAGGRALFADNCAPCHGSGGGGAHNYPALADDAWIWGGSLEAIAQTIHYGVRSGHADTRLSEMPRFGTDGILSAEEIAAVADYVVALGANDPRAAQMAAEKALQSQQVFADNCAACHGENGKGNADLGAPNLTDAIWTYGSGRDAVVAQVNNPRHGVMPAWTGRLSDAEIRQLAIYVHSLGGGE